MNAGELMEFLSAFPATWPVILQKDAEGNGYSPCAGADDAYYEAETTWYGEVIDEEYLDGYDKEEIKERLDAATRCIVLYPVN